MDAAMDACTVAVMSSLQHVVYLHAVLKLWRHTDLPCPRSSVQNLQCLGKLFCRRSQLSSSMCKRKGGSIHMRHWETRTCVCSQPDFIFTISTVCVIAPKALVTPLPCTNSQRIHLDACRSCKARRETVRKTTN